MTLYNQPRKQLIQTINSAKKLTKFVRNYASSKKVDTKCKMPEPNVEDLHAESKVRYWQMTSVKRPAVRTCPWVPCFQRPEDFVDTCKPGIYEKEVPTMYNEDLMSCGDPCVRDFPYPRLDVLFYQPSCHDKRLYQQTWNECLPLKRVSGITQHIYPNMKRSSKRIKLPESACAQDGAKMKNICEKRVEIKANIPTGNPRCPKITMPACCPVRPKLKCESARKPKDCERYCTQYPSYSECVRPCDIPLPPTECNCCTMSMCEVWREFRRRKHGVRE